MPGTRKSKTLAKKKTSPILDKLEQISVADPIPFEGGRGFSLVNESEYLQFLSGSADDRTNADQYARLLLQARLLSTTQNACIVTKRDYCAGAGFQLEDETDISNRAFNRWTQSMNMQDDDVVEVNKQILESDFTYGNVPIELARFSIGRKRYFYIYVHNMMEWRLGKPNDGERYSWYAIQSKLFLRQQGFGVVSEKDLENAVKLPLYNPLYKNRSTTKPIKGYNWVRDSKGVERTMIWYKHSVTGFDNYGLPSNVAGLIYEILEYKGARFNLDNIENGAVVSAILALKGALTQTEVNRIGKKVVNTHTGDGKRGRVMVVASEEGIDGSDLHSLETHKEGSFKESDDSWTGKIILANQWDAILAGITAPSTLGKGSGYLTKIIEHKQNTVIRPKQQDLMKRVWKKILPLAADWLGFSVDVDKVQIKNMIDISGLTDVDITPAVKVDEVREARGLVKLKGEKGDQLLGEMKGNQMKGVYVKPGGKSNTDPNTGAT